MEYGARGTDDLPPEQRPRKLTRRAQPYRRRKARQLGPTLEAMLRGESGSSNPELAYGNPSDFRRARQAALKRIYGRGISGA
jgi:hypothetical protein